ncbi:P-loop containing nucleoside triphosphate hydrolase protein [Whalleya microplaca]|nr:P-loop containing nucleoside triphosphate hydrolase protein [Whalleya microplaca]
MDSEATRTPEPERKHQPKSSKMMDLVQTELKDKPKNTRDQVVQEGAWDPYTHGALREDMTRFFSGHKMHRQRLEDRERYARWAIEEALREYLPEECFKVSGQVVQDETVSWGAGNGTIPKTIGEAIRADGQYDIDAEDPNGPKDTGCEIVQSVNTVAETIISSSPNSVGPPIQACIEYLQMKRCGEYGRNNLAVWRSPLFPLLDNQDGRKGLLDNQITAIVWILSRFLGELPRLRFKDPENRTSFREPETIAERQNRESLRGPKYHGGILGDSMGLGKTLATIACLSLLAEQKLNVRRDKDKHKYYHPMLILTPNAAVAQQWVDGIEETTKHSAIDKIIITGNGLQSKRGHTRVHTLNSTEFLHWPKQLDYVWNIKKHRAAKTVLVMTIDTWSGRTCKSRVNDEIGEEWYSTFTERKREFSVVVVDEAYKVKNSSTRNWKSVALLKRQFTLLVTATPCMNTLTDLLGLARLLWQTPEEYLQENNERWCEIEGVFRDVEDLTYLDDVEPWDDLQIAAGRPALLARLIRRQWGPINYDIQDIRKYLKHFESLAVLRRSPTSYLFNDWQKTQPISLEGLLPNVGNYTVDIEPDKALAKVYQDAHADLLIDYLGCIQPLVRDHGKKRAMVEKEAIKSTMKPLRLFQIAAASLDVFELDQVLSAHNFGTKVEHISTMRRNGVTFLRLAQFLIKPGDPKPEVGLDYVKLAVRQSPILRYILHYIRENILNRERNGKIRKLMITEASPILAYYYELVLQFLGFNCRAFHSDLSNDARKELIDDFNNDEDPSSCQILIQMYTVGFAGSNLHKSCSRVIIASQAHSLAVQSQTIHRVIRVGQLADVTVHRLKVNNTFHEFRESRQLEKIIPELGTRAQGDMKAVLVQLLNLFQCDVEDAWKSPEAQRLLETKNLLSDQVSESEVPENLDEQKNKRIKLEDGTARANDSSSEAIKLPRMRKRHKTGDGKAGWFKNPELGLEDDEAAFLRLRTRESYYEEFKNLPKEAKSRFNHEKNKLRRLLSYHNEDRSQWTVSDLDNAAVLERAIELTLRLRLGSQTSAMLPLPLVDLSLVSAKKRRELRRLLGQNTLTDQDVERAREEAEGSKSKGKEKVGAVRLAITSGETNDEIDEALRMDVRQGAGAGATARNNGKKIGKGDSKEDVEPRLRDIPMWPGSVGHGGNEGSEEDGREDDEAAEGEEESTDDDEIEIVGETRNLVNEREESPGLEITNWKRWGDVNDPVDLTNADEEAEDMESLKKPKVEGDDAENRG